MSATATKCRPILFSAEMVRAILAGRKTVTRRLIDPQPHEEHCLRPGEAEWYAPTRINRRGVEYPGPDVFGVACEERGWVCPYGAPGDTLWVREGFRLYRDNEDGTVSYHGGGPYNEGEYKVEYRADSPYHACRGGWKPGIHMPRWASRITLGVVSIRAERLHDITEEDAIREGVEETSLGFRDYDLPCGVMHGVPAEYSFKTLWDSINAGRAPWASNPWVWRIEFDVRERGA